MSRASRLRRQPVRVRLVASFIAVMLAVLTAAGAFVYWRVQVALDSTLNGELGENARTLQGAWSARPDAAGAVAALPSDALAQVLDPSGQLLTHTAAARGVTLLTADDVRAARTSDITLTRGNLLTGGKHRVRLRVIALPAAAGQQSDLAVVAVRLGQRDEALRELLAQLAAANLLALAAATVVGYRLARAALAPVERYRTRAQQITDGATGLRLEVPADVDDEVSRLGHTLNQMLTAQEQAAAQQRQFLADASHELRSPLTVLSSEVELALRRPRTLEEYQRTLEQVSLDTARLVTLADQLLDLDAASRRRPIPSGGADVLAAAERAAARARSRSADSDRTVTVHRPDELDHRLSVGLSDTAMDQVLGNLADNAIVHGTGNVTLSVTHALEDPSDPDGSEVVRVTVSDEGAGPPAEFIAHAVERFRRADQARTTAGNGLGLALVHTLIADCGGELRLCVGATHHRYPPTAFEQVPCAHAEHGTNVTLVLQGRAGT